MFLRACGDGFGDKEYPNICDDISLNLQSSHKSLCEEVSPLLILSCGRETRKYEIRVATVTSYNDKLQVLLH